MELVHKDGRQSVVLFATPSFEKAVSLDFHNSMLATVSECVRRRIPFGTRILSGNQFIDFARNELVDYFLHSPEGFTDLFFIDADEGWDASVIPRFLDAKQGVVCGLYPKRCDPPTYHQGALTGHIEDGLFQALEAPAGFMRIKREVFARMDNAFPGLSKDVGNPFCWPHTPYFQRGSTKHGVIGEDIFFSRQLIEMGEYLWIDSDVNFTHRGSNAWKGNFYDHLKATGLLRSA